MEKAVMEYVSVEYYIAKSGCVYQVKMDRPGTHYICLDAANDMRKTASNLKLTCPSLNIRMIVKLFHTDKAFDGIFIRSITFNEATKVEQESYSVILYKVKEVVGSNTEYGDFDVRIDNTTNWKTFKQLIQSTMDECPICCEEYQTQLPCPICAKFICSSCVVSNFLKRGNQRCPYCACNMDTQYDDEDFIRGGLKFVMNSDLITDEVRWKMAVGLCEKTFKRKIRFTKQMKENHQINE